MNNKDSDLAALIAQLITVQSIGGDELGIAHFISGWLTKAGLTPELVGSNVICRIPGQNRSDCLILSDHIDTVQAGDVSRWKHNPFAGEVKDGLLYGLGASDMKAGVACIMVLAQKYHAHKPACDLLLVFVGEEKISGNVTTTVLDYLLGRKWFKDYAHVEALIGEPTDNSFLGIGHRGSQFVTVKLTGDSGHASMPEKIKTSVMSSVDDLMYDIKALIERWEKAYVHPQLGVPTIGVTQIVSGDVRAPNKIAGTCDVTLDIRTTPDLHSKLRRELEALTEDQSKGTIDLVFGDTWPVGFCPPSARLRQIFTSQQPKLQHQSIQGSADMCFFTDKNIPTVIFGPGQREHMHAANESVRITSMGEYCQMMSIIIEEYGSYGK